MTTTALVAWVVKGGFLLASAALASLLLSKAPAAVRHLVWTAALAGALALPLVERAGLVPSIAVPASWLPAAGGTNAEAFVSEARPHGAAAQGDVGLRGEAATDARHPAEAETDARLHAAAETEVRSHAEAEAHVRIPAELPSEWRGDDSRDARVAAASAVTDEPGAGPGARSLPALGARSLPALATLWLAGALLLLGRAARSTFAAWRLTRRRARPAPPEAQLVLERLAREVGVRGRVRLVVADVRVPATWGLVTGTVVLPEAHRSWSACTLEHVILHELAHVRRRDCLSHLLGDVARALRWYDPLAWLAVHRQRVESERACDDLVLAYGRTASAYAEDLLRLVRALRLPGATPPRAALAMARTSLISDRLGAILDARRARGPVRPAVRAGVAAAALALTLSAAGAVPEPAEREPTGPEPVASESTNEEGAEERRTASESTSPERTEQRAAASGSTAREPSGDLPLASEQTAAPAWAMLEPPRREPSPLAETRTTPEVTRVRPARTAVQSVELCVFRESESRSTNIHMNDDVTRIRWETDSCRMEIDLEGDVEFTADDRGVARMDDGALFEVEERDGRSERRARFEGRDGGIERRFWVDGDEVPWSPEADRWIAQVLPELFRHTTINAEARVRRMVAEGGPERVFEEVALMRSDHVRSTYLRLLMASTDLDEAALVRVIDFAGRIESGHTAAELLLDVVEQAGLRESFQDPLVRAAEGIESDHEKGRVLGRLLGAPDLSPAQLDAVVRSAATIESDHGLSQVLTAVARRGALDAAGRAAFLGTLATIESDHSQGVVVDAFLDAGTLSGEELSAVLALTRGIESDHERGRILQRVARDQELTGTQVTAYLESARGIESDHETGSTARAILERPSFGPEHLGLVLSMAENVESDHERAGILQAVVARRPLEGAEVLRLIEVASGIGSDHERAETLQRAVREQDLDDAAVLAVIESAAGIGSDHNQSQVLLALAERHTLGGQALARYRALAGRLSRQYEDRLLAALVR